MAVNLPTQYTHIATFNTNVGSFTVGLFGNDLPITVGSFVNLIENGFYNGISFHRVIKGFMSQFGNPEAREASYPAIEPSSSFLTTKGEQVNRIAGKIPDENIAPFSNLPFTLSMANTGRPNSNGTQFFINAAHNKYLDYFDNSTPSKHPVFGIILDGKDVIVNINSVQTGPRDVPINPIIVTSATVVKN